jgi:hypothetical protein
MNDNKSKLAFKSANYIMMIIGIIILAIGFFIMTLDKETYGFGFLGLTLGPIIVVFGFIFEIVAILYRGGKK